jgi:hypothetical protein
MRLADFDALTFDCYGTLIDWESGIVTALQPLLARVAPPLTRDAVLESFARHETRLEKAHPRMLYRELLTHVHDALADDWGVATSATESRRFGQSVGYWPAFDDTEAALRYLQLHYRLVILSMSIVRVSARATPARRDVRCDLHRRGCRLVKAGPAQLHVDGRAACDDWHRAVSHPAHRAEPVPRPRAGERRGDCISVDRSAARCVGLGRNLGTACERALRLPLHRPR